LAYGENVEYAKQTLEKALAGIAEIRAIPAPWTYIHDANENWVEIKAIYFIDSYGSQFNVADKVYSRGLEALQSKGLKLARQVIEISDKTPSHGGNKL
jgi:small-conductance mechanosensitive channel